MDGSSLKRAKTFRSSSRSGQGIGSPGALRRPAAAVPRSAGGKSPSHAAHRAEQRALQGPPIRLALISRVRAQIAAGTYETPVKIEVVLDRLTAHLQR